MGKRRLVGKMITTVTLNASVDKTYYLDDWEPGGIFRVKRIISEPGGKGNNVAKVIKQLGGEPFATGVIGGENGEFIKSQLEKQGINTSFVEVSENSRVCLNIINEKEENNTELLESGPFLSPEKQRELILVIKELAVKSTAVILSGSLPLGTPNCYYRELIEIIKSAGSKAYLDTSGQPLYEGLKAVPYFIKPNESELKGLIGRDNPLTDMCLLEAAERLSETGISQVCITLGERGTIAGIQGDLFRISLPKLRALNPVGCGDAFVAGMAYGNDMGESSAECLKIASAAASANAMSQQAGKVDSSLFFELLPQVKVEKLS